MLGLQSSLLLCLIRVNHLDKAVKDSYIFFLISLNTGTELGMRNHDGIHRQKVRKRG